MVRRPRKIPPMPIESAMVCLRPYFLGISKSMRVASCIPIWTMLTTKSAPSSARLRSRCSSTFASAPSRSEVQRAIIPAVSRRSGSISCRAMVVPRSSGKLRVSVRRFLVKTTLPAPIKAIFKFQSFLSTPVGRQDGADHAKLDPDLRELWQPSHLRPKHPVYTRADFGQRTDGGRQGVEHDRMMHRLHIARESGLDGQLLHVDVGSIEGRKLWRIVFDRR